MEKGAAAAGGRQRAPPSAGPHTPDWQVHDGESVMRMLDACELAARVLQYAGTLVKVSSEHFCRSDI